MGEIRQSMVSSVGVRTSVRLVEAVESDVKDDALSRSGRSLSLGRMLTVDCSRGYLERLCGGRVRVRE